MSLEIKSLSKSFEGTVIFDNFSYSFPKTGLFVITGESGRGKTTLLRIISGLDKNYSGEVNINGNVSYLFQEYRLFPNLSLIDNILYTSFDTFNEADKEKTEDLLSELGFSKEDFNLHVDELSGGMKQRTAFARAILRECPVLLLDEPTKELDQSLKEKVVDIIKKEAKKRLVLFVTHDEDYFDIKEAVRLAF